ncbi:MAG TPA: hypothetical protein VM223_21550 [Planctomycetota bacterium]|nr:hypothetical protein [Planctomycetota bacterium]
MPVFHARYFRVLVAVTLCTTVVEAKGVAYPLRGPALEELPGR